MQTYQNKRGTVIGCGCCAGPEDDRCCCHMHQDTSRGLKPHKCSLHREVSIDEPAYSDFPADFAGDYPHYGEV